MFSLKFSTIVYSHKRFLFRIFKKSKKTKYLFFYFQRVVKTNIRKNKERKKTTTETNKQHISTQLLLVTFKSVQKLSVNLFFIFLVAIVVVISVILQYIFFHILFHFSSSSSSSAQTATA